MFNPYALLAGLGIWAASLVAVGVWQNEAGQNKVEAARASELRQHFAAYQRAATAALARERADVVKINDIAGRLERSRDDAKKTQDDRQLAVTRNTLRLWDPGARACPAAPLVAPSTPAPERDDTKGAQLSKQAAGFLLTLTSDADHIARQLTACQQILISDRK